MRRFDILFCTLGPCKETRYKEFEIDSRPEIAFVQDYVNPDRVRSINE
jgi:hypothetical protein